jgi:hypothetical protein
MEMLNFDVLSLNDTNVLEMPELPIILQQHQQHQEEHIDIMNSETMKELFINLFLNETPNISFEEMQEKLIEFYFQEANEELISRHIDDIYDNLDESVIAHIQYRIRYRDYNDDINQYNLNSLIEFISISEGNEYLQDIYNMLSIDYI